MNVAWSLFGGAPCVRVAGATGSVCVRAGDDSDLSLPVMAGRTVVDESDLCFVPRFPFVEGAAYSVFVDGAVVAVLVRPGRQRSLTTRVVSIGPDVVTVPRNLLRLYLEFSAPMGEGDAARGVQLVDDAGAELDAALLPVEYELWNGDRTRLTVLLDPARIKRGLAGHRALGYPLRTGDAFTVVVDAGFRDAGGTPLVGPARRRYEVGDDQRGLVDPDRWTVHATADTLVVTFDRPLDRALAARCLAVTGQVGTATLTHEQREWRFTPSSPFAPGVYELVVDPVLEDLAGNSVSRVFDRDLDEDHRPVATRRRFVVDSPT